MKNESVMKNESWDVRMDGDMVIAGLSERTREAYLRAARQLAKFHRMADPGTLEEQHVKDYLLWLRTEKRAAPGTLRIAFNGIRFFYRHTCPRDCITLLKFRIPKETKLPAVLTIDELQRIMNAIRLPRFRAYFWTVYSCGLRLNEALALQVGDIDSQRMRIHVHRGKGAKDRLVPLPAATLEVLRDYWKTHRHPTLLFPKTNVKGVVVNSTRPGFFVPVKLLSQLFRIEFERLLKEQLTDVVLPAADDFRREFVSDVEAVGDGVATLKYLSRYVFRTAITNQRILSLRDGQVTFSYRRSGEQRDRLMTLPVFEFLRRFLQHVLPQRLQKIRHYGFLSRCSKIDLDDVRAAILESLKDVEPDLELEAWTVPSLHPASHFGEDTGPKCPTCGGPLIFERFHRIWPRPPPLTHASRQHGTRFSAVTTPEDIRQSNVTRF